MELSDDYLIKHFLIDEEKLPTVETNFPRCKYLQKFNHLNQLYLVSDG